MTTFISERASVWRSAAIGVLWGVGHTLALFVAGVMILMLNITIPERFAVLLELCVAAMIIFLGARILYLLLRNRQRLHVHTHQHGGQIHSHLHFHDRQEGHSVNASPVAGHVSHAGASKWRPVIVGMVHGLAGSAALPLLVLTELSQGGSRLRGVTYLLTFGFGSVVGMFLMSTIISLPFVFTANRIDRFHNPLRWITGLASIAFGFYYAWQVAAPYA